MDVTIQPAGTRTASDSLPEALGPNGTQLFASDALCAVIVIACFGVAGDGAAAYLTLVATLLIALATGRYRRSFCALAAEEWYAAGGIALLGMLCGLVLTFALHFDWFVGVASAILWTALAGAASSYMTRLRRGDRRFALAIDRVRERPISTGSHIERALIRALDATFAAIALVVLSPLLAVVALAIAIDDGLPVLFSQTRVARDDRDFTMWKFRTMGKGADSTWASPGDNRITRTGAFLRRSSIDELPQLWNVLRGDMSLVGPRPEMREYADSFAREVQQYSQRHIIAPGLTGWAQVRMPRNLQPSDAPDVLRHDLFYVQHVGLQLYTFCLMKTAWEFIGHRAV